MAREQAPVDFVEIFNERLNAIAPCSDRDARESALTTTDLKVDMIKKRVPAIVFTATRERNVYLKDTIRGIWIEIPETLDYDHYPHNQLHIRLSGFVGQFGLRGSKQSSAELLVDGEGKRHLLLDTMATINAERHEEHLPEEFREFWRGLVDNYGLDSLVSSNFDYDLGENVKIITSDMMWRHRAGNVVSEIAQAHQMTNSEFLRFWALTVDDKERKQQGSWEQIAKEIVTPKWAARV